MTEETVSCESRSCKDQAIISRLFAQSNDSYETHIKLEDEFQQTLGLARALETCPTIQRRSGGSFD